MRRPSRRPPAAPGSLAAAARGGAPPVGGRDADVLQADAHAPGAQDHAPALHHRRAPRDAARQRVYALHVLALAPHLAHGRQVAALRGGGCADERKGPPPGDAPVAIRQGSGLAGRCPRSAAPRGARPPARPPTLPPTPGTPCRSARRPATAAPPAPRHPHNAARQAPPTHLECLVEALVGLLHRQPHVEAAPPGGVVRGMGGAEQAALARR